MKILITGACGNIGKYISIPLSKKHDITAVDISDEGFEYFKEENIDFQILDIRNPAHCNKIIKDFDMVIHFAGEAMPDADFQSLEELNIEGTKNVISSCSKSGVKRFIYASSIHAVSGYPSDKQIEIDDPVRPGDLYGVSKCFNEALCSYFAYHKGMECMAIRIGSYNAFTDEKENLNLETLSIFISPEDMLRLIEACIAAEMKEPFYILHGVSDNTYKHLSLYRTKELVDYHPQDNSFIIARVSEI
ncbi:MAG: NAD(P)-dependent oxidoreductase [Gallicola sp.]|nr:NAD(P)-dependent oxidoreductase [Gallicola sp.]